MTPCPIQYDVMDARIESYIFTETKLNYTLLGPWILARESWARHILKTFHPPNFVLANGINNVLSSISCLLYMQTIWIPVYRKL